MKFKWAFPFLVPFGALFVRDPHATADLTGRVLNVSGVLAVSLALLIALKPWRHDDGRDEGFRLSR